MEIGEHLCILFDSLREKRRRFLRMYVSYYSGREEITIKEMKELSNELLYIDLLDEAYNSLN